MAEPPPKQILNSRLLEIEAAMAQELLTALSPFGGALPRSCLFRGHTDVHWQLLPTVFRFPPEHHRHGVQTWTVDLVPRTVPHSADFVAHAFVP